MSAIASQITSLTIVCSTVYSGADEKNHQSSPSLVFVWGIHRSAVNSPHKGPVTRKMFPFDDVIRCLHKLKPQNHTIQLCYLWRFGRQVYCNISASIHEPPWHLSTPSQALPTHFPNNCSTLWGTLGFAIHDCFPQYKARSRGWSWPWYYEFSMFKWGIVK